MPASYNYYEILGLTKEAGAAEIKAAYRQLAMKYHPDKNPSPDAHKQFVAVNAAHRVLSDPFKRKVYDLRRQAGRVIQSKPKSPRAHPVDREDPEEMRRRYWASPEGQQRSKWVKKEANFFRKFHYVAKIISIPLLLFMLLFLVESNFPKKIENQKVAFIEYPSGGGVYKLGNYPVRVHVDYAHCLKKNEWVDVYLGRIFNLVAAVGLPTTCADASPSNLSGKNSYIIVPSRSLFGRLGFPIYLVILFIAILWIDPNSETGNAAFILAIACSWFVFSLFSKLFV